MGIWKSVNPRLPLISKRFAAVSKNINRKHNKAAAKRNLANKLDSLFDMLGAPVL